jgi:uncharacterized integral membrane protein
MRWVYLAIVVAFVAAIVMSVVQNRELVTKSFLGFGVRAPPAILAVIAYVLGVITGGSVYALLRKLVSESQLTGAR